MLGTARIRSRTNRWQDMFETERCLINLIEGIKENLSIGVEMKNSE